MKANWLYIVLNRPWLVLLIGLLFVVAAASGGKNLYFRADYKIFFEKENEQLQAFEQMESEFSKNDSATIVISPKDGVVFKPETLKLIKEITDEAWQTPFSNRVDSIANFQHTYAEQDDLIVEDLVYEADAIDKFVIDNANQVAMGEPDLVDKAISNKGHVTTVNITVQLPDQDRTQAVAEVATYVKQLSSQFQAQYPEHDFYHTGIVFMNQAFADEAQRDASTLVPLMFLVIIVVMWALLRSFTATFATVIVIITSIAATMGIAGWLGIFLSTATVNAPTLIMTLAVADCVHLIASMHWGLRQGMEKREAISYAMKLNLMPIFITSATTSIGFLTMNFSDVPVLADLGNVSAIGVMLAFFFAITILPALLLLFPANVAKHQNKKSGKMEDFAEWVIAHHRKLLPITALVVVGSIWASTTNNVNDVATEYFDNTTEFRQSTNFQEQNISGMSTIDFAIYAEEASSLNKPEMLSVVRNFSDWLRQQPEVDHVNTISDTFKRLNKNMHGDDESYYRLPENQELAAQYLLLYEMSLPYGLDLNNRVNLNKSATRLVVTFKNLGSKEFTGFEQRAIAWLSENGPQFQLKAASPTLMFAHIGERNMKSMLEGTLLALLLISGLLVFALRSARMGAISLLPNLLPAALGFGIWAVISGEVNLGLSVVLSMALGIIVDDTVHFLSKYQVARREGKNAEDAIRYAFSSVGRALVITTIVLVMGFSVLAMSSFALNADMGLLTGIIILVALIVDFLFLPAFLLVLDKKSYTEGRADNADQTAQAA